MIRYLTIGILLAFTGLCNDLHAQNGNYFMTQHAPTLPAVDNSNFVIVQDNNGIINVANRSGLLRFDGQVWERTSTPASIFSLAFDSVSNAIYCGGYFGLGKFKLNDKNILEYVSIADSSQNIGIIYQLMLSEQKLIGLGDDVIYSFDLSNRSSTTITPKYSGSFNKLFLLSGQVFVSTENSGLKLINGNKLVNPSFKGISNLDIEFILPPTKNNPALIGTSSNELYTLENGEVAKLSIKDPDNYISQSGFLAAEWVNSNLLAVSTFNGGVILIDYKTRKINQIINYQSGLPDNEVYAISRDTNQGLWVAHSNGFTRISFQLPLRNFSYYEGLEGKILSTIYHRNKLYVGTSSGLYILKKINLFDEVNYVEKDEVKIKSNPVEKNQPVKKKRKFLGLFKKKKAEPVSSAPTEELTKTIYRTKTSKKLRATTYQYVKLDGISSRVTHLASYNNAVYCSSLDGVFKIVGDTPSKLSSEPAKYISVAPKTNLIFATTQEDKILTFDLAQGGNLVDLFSDYKDNIQHIFEQEKGVIWLTSDDEILTIKVDDNEIYETVEYPIENAFFSATYGQFEKDQLQFVNQSGIFKINADNKFERTSDVKPSRYLLGSNNLVWILRNEKWNSLDGESVNEDNLLNVFKNLGYISLDDEDNYWVVTNQGELIKLNKSNQTISETYDLYLKQVATNDSILSINQKLRFEQSKNTLTFQFSQPEFSGILGLKYQYQLEGLSKDWSEWSDNYNSVNFNYLPEGNYKLKVRSKDVLGKIKEIEPVEFRVVPPYWKRPWFYALEFTLLALLLLGSIRLKDLGFKYRLASRLLALITLIIIIEFIQTIAEHKFADESSPVIDFLIQVSIAIIVLPVESLIRKFIFGEKNVGIFDFAKLKNKSS